MRRLIPVRLHAAFSRHRSLIRNLSASFGIRFATPPYAVLPPFVAQLRLAHWFVLGGAAGYVLLLPRAISDG